MSSQGATPSPHILAQNGVRPEESRRKQFEKVQSLLREGKSVLEACIIAEVPRRTYYNYTKRNSLNDGDGFRDKRFAVRAVYAAALEQVMASATVTCKRSCKDLVSEVISRLPTDKNRKTISSETVRRLLQAKRAQYKQVGGLGYGRWYSEDELRSIKEDKDEAHHQQRVADVEAQFAKLLKRWKRKAPRGKAIGIPVARFVEAHRQRLSAEVMQSAEQIAIEGPLVVQSIDNGGKGDGRRAVKAMSHAWVGDRRHILEKILRISDGEAKGEVLCEVTPTSAGCCAPDIPRCGVIDRGAHFEE